MKRKRNPDEERKLLFRRMDRVFVLGPPILAVLVGIFGSFLIAALVPIPSIGFWGRWFLAVLIILVFPVIVFVVRESRKG